MAYEVKVYDAKGKLKKTIKKPPFYHNKFTEDGRSMVQKIKDTQRMSIKGQKVDFDQHDRDRQEIFDDMLKEEMTKLERLAVDE